MASNKNKRRKRSKSKTKPDVAAPQGQARMGRPPYVATPEMRQVVELMVGHGIAQAEIAKAITPPCSVNTLAKVFAEEIERARPRFKGLIARSQHLHLVGRPAEYDANGNVVREEMKPDKVMSIFLGKVVLGQRERMEVTGKDGRPLIGEDMLALLGSDEKRRQFTALLEEMTSNALLQQETAEDTEVQRYASLAGQPTKLN